MYVLRRPDVVVALSPSRDNRLPVFLTGIQIVDHLIPIRPPNLCGELRKLATSHSSCWRLNRGKSRVITFQQSHCRDVISFQSIQCIRPFEARKPIGK